jgi:hypothetical protein
VNAILSNMPRLVVAKQAARAINAESEALLTDTTKLADEYGNGSTRARSPWRRDRVRRARARVPAARRQAAARRRALRAQESEARTSATRRRFFGC